MEDKLFLLSKEEFEKYKNKIPLQNDWWWLRTPGFMRTISAVIVPLEGKETLFGDFIYNNFGGIRPAFYLDADSEFLKARKKTFTMGEYDGKPVAWIILDRETGLCISMDILCKHRFDEKFNDYDTSEIRRFLRKMEKEIFMEKTFTEKYAVAPPEELRELCIRESWFTGGDNRQYSKMFDLNREGNFSEVALAVWLCSDAGREEITEKLEELHESWLETVGNMRQAQGERDDDEAYCASFDGDEREE